MHQAADSSQKGSVCGGCAEHAQTRVCLQLVALLLV
jgi:hypothetical protein